MSLIVENLCKSYPTRSGNLDVLRGVNLTLADAEALAILGPSGSGKSTLLYLLGTLERPSSGTYKLGDQEPFTLTDAALAHFRNRSIGFVFQDHHLLPQCSVLENVLIPTLAGRRGESEAAGPAIARARRPVASARSSPRGAVRRRTAARRRRPRSHPQADAVARRRADRQSRSQDGPDGRRTAAGMHQQEKTMLIVVTHSPELAKLLPQPHGNARRHAGPLVRMHDDYVRQTSAAQFVVPLARQHRRLARHRAGRGGA